MAAKKIQILVFYRVNNPLGFDGHSFDDIDDNEEQKEVTKLFKYTDGDCNNFIYIYSLKDLSEFQEDFNDENCDLGDGTNWWCKLLTISF